jgi:hypothetical protein
MFGLFKKKACAVPSKFNYPYLVKMASLRLAAQQAQRGGSLALLLSSAISVSLSRPASNMLFSAFAGETTR